MDKPVMTADKKLKSINAPDARVLVFRTHRYFIYRWRLIHSFREVGLLGVQNVQGDLIINEQDRIKTVFESTKMQPVGPETTTTQTAYVAEQLGPIIANTKVDDFVNSMDAAALIFAHATIDNIALQCCKISSLFSPNDWFTNIAQNKIAVRDVREKNFQEIISSQMSGLFRVLERDSLEKKISTFLSKCGPITLVPDGSIDNYQFSMDEIKKIDRLRHKIVHGKKITEDLDDCKRDLTYLEKTSFLLILLVIYKYQITIDMPALVDPLYSLVVESLREFLGERLLSC